jgi:hypothetical protein
MPQKLRRYTIDTVWDCPPWFYWVFSFASRKMRQRTEWLLGPIADTIQVMIVFLFCLSISGNYLASFIAGLIFSIVPILIKPDARTFFFSPRPYGELFATLAILFALLFVVYYSLWFGVASVIFTSLVLLTGKFPTQAVLFSFLGFSVFYLTLWFLLFFLLGLAFAILLSKGYYLKTLRAHIRHSRFYQTTIVHRHTWTRTVSGFGELKSLLSRDLGRKARARTVLLRNPLVNALAFAPFLPLFWIMIPFAWDTLTSDRTLISMAVWANVMFLLVMVISIRQLRFLGEAERYEGFGVFPLCILVPILLLSLNSLLFWVIFSLVVAFSVVLVYFNYKTSARFFGGSKKDKDSSEEFFEFLQSIPAGRVLCVPANISPEITYKTTHSTLYWGGSLPGRNFSHEEFDELFAEFPYPNRQLGRVAKKYGADIIVFSKRGTEEEIGKIEYDLEGYEIVFQNDNYSVYRSVAD